MTQPSTFVCLFVGIAAGTFPGCSGNEQVRSTTATRDSAGITIVESTVDTAGLRVGWMISETPTLSIGDLDGPEDQMLSGVSGGARLADGRIAIVDGGSFELRVFGSDGSLLARYGREGEGPGEFTSPRLAGVRGDSLLVYDGRLRRLSMLHPDEGFVRSYLVGEEGGGFPVAVGALSDGSIVFGGGMSFSSADGFEGGLQRPTSRYVILDAVGEVRGDLGDVPATEMFGVVRDGGFRISSIPFPRATRAATAPDQLWLGTAETWEIRAYSPEAELTRIARLDRPLASVSDAMWEAMIEDRVSSAESDAQAREIQNQIAEMPRNEFVPPYQTMIVDALSHLWVGEYTLPGETRSTYTVLDPDGSPVGRITLPPSTLPLDIGADYLLGLTRDELDVQHVTVWRLARP